MCMHVSGRTCGGGEQRTELREAAMSSRDGQLGREREREVKLHECCKTISTYMYMHCRC